MIRDLPHVLARVFNVPLLIEPARMEPLLVGLYATMFRRGALSPPGDAPAPPEVRPRGYRIDRGVAIVPVRGVLVRRAGQMTPDSTLLQSYQNLTQVLRAARSDNRVRGILLDVDSPGGEAGGVFDFADEVRQTTQIKPVWAIANDDALSAAYAIAAAAERVWITNTGAAGSIGVVALHADQSRFDAEAGFDFTYIYKGARKIDANPHMRLSPEARGHIQGEVDRLYDMLIAKAAGHRGITAERLAATEASIYFGDNALGIGLADRVGTLDDATNALAERVALNSRRGTAGMNSEDTANSDARTTDDAAAANPLAPSGAQPDNVISFDQIHQAVAATRETAAEIVAYECLYSGDYKRQFERPKYKQVVAEALMPFYPKYTTTVIGAYSVPRWYEPLDRLVTLGQLLPEDMVDAQYRVMQGAIVDQETAGIDLITGGETHRRTHNRHSPPNAMLNYFWQKIPAFHGETRPKPITKCDPNVTHPAATCQGPITDDIDLGLVDEFNDVSASAHKPVKITMTGPHFLTAVTFDEHYNDSARMMFDAAKLLNNNFKKLVQAGCKHIQIDEPYLTPPSDDEVRIAVEAINIAIEDLPEDIHVAVHVCQGNYAVGPQYDGQIGHRYFDTGRYKADLICQIECDSYLIEHDRTDAFREVLGNKQLGVGAVDVQAPNIETGEVIVERIIAHPWLAPDQTIITSTCGFNHLPRHVALGKMRSMTEAKAILFAGGR